VRIDEYSKQTFEEIRKMGEISNEIIIKSFNPDKNHRIFKNMNE
jgi:hypothetical protein